MIKNKLKKVLLTTFALVISLLPVSAILASDTLYEYYVEVDSFAPLFDTELFVVGQTFTPQTSHDITSIKLKLYKTGNPGTIYAYIFATSGGLPTGYDLLQKSYNGDTITVNTAGEWIEFVFASSYQLNASTKYALMLRAPSATAGNNIYIGLDNTSPTYTRGNLIWSDDVGISWNANTGQDLGFYEYGLSLVSLPTVTTQAVTTITGNTATGNGNITATGGENATKRGVVYDITSYGNPGNVSPATSNYGYKVEATGSFSTGAFTASLTGLDVGETYYVRAYAYNSKGYSYGGEVNFTTDLITPTVTINAASNVAKTSARLNSLLNDDGGENCDIRFAYSLNATLSVNWDAPDVGDTITAWVSGYSSSEHPYLDIASLTANSPYYFAAQARNSEGTVTSAEATFTTEATIAVCTNFKALPQATSVSLSWIKGLGASQTLIRYSFDTYPALVTDGVQLYLGTGSSTTHTGLAPGTAIYYTAFGESDGAYSAGVDLLTTTSASSATGVDVDSPIMPANWFLDTDYTTMSNFEPLFTTINDSADALNMPRSTVWYLAAIIFCVLCSYGTYQIGHHELVPAGVVLVICIGLMSAVQLIPMYMMFLIVIVVIGVGVARRSM